MEKVGLPKAQQLGDLELATLLCLIANQHCILTAREEDLEHVAHELALICGQTFRLPCAVVGCSQNMTLDDFREGVLVTAEIDDEDIQRRLSRGQKSPSLSHSLRGDDFNKSLDERTVASVVITKHLNHANRFVQTQALELIRNKRLYSRMAMHAAPKSFLLVSLQSTDSGTRLSPHLNELFAISHRYYGTDSFPVKGPPKSTYSSDDGSSLSSIQRSRSPRLKLPEFRSLSFSRDEIEMLRDSVSRVHVKAEVSAYLHNVVIFMRMSRYVSAGVTAPATRQLREIIKALAVIHGQSYVPPSLVDLAVRKVYPHRLVLATDRNERSLQWGSDAEAVRRLMKDMTVERAIEEVLSTVETPL